MKNVIIFYNVLKKDMKTYYLKPPNISWGIIFPFAWMLMMFIRTGDAFSIEEVFPGIVALSVLFGTTSMLAVTITFEKKSRSFERLLLSPLPLAWLISAKLAGAFMFGIANTILPVLISTVYFKSDIQCFAKLLFGIVLLSAVSTLIGLYISVSAKEVFEAQTYSNFFRFPMIFLCGLFVPLMQLPLYLRVVSFSIPVTYAVDMIRRGITGLGSVSFTLSVIILILSSIVLFYSSLIKIRKNWFF